MRNYLNYIENNIYIYLVGSTILCLCLYLCLYDINRGADLTTQNDEWEHQSLAVNYAQGFGLFKLGGYADFKDYHIDSYDYAFPFIKKLFIKYPSEYYHRACGFSVITGTLYKITGNHPYNLRIFNFILILICWLIIYYSHYLFGNDKKLSTVILLALPVFIIINFPFIDLIGDDTLIVFSLSLVFISLLNWQNKPGYMSTLFLLIAILFSLFIKSTLFFIPVFLFIISLFYKKKHHIIFSFIVNIFVMMIVLIFSVQLNKKHHNYNYVEQNKFHTDVIESEWNQEDNLFIKEYDLKYVPNKNNDFNSYKKIAAYLFERQFYTKRMFILSGQSWFLLIDGNNECAAALFDENNGNWAPQWKFFKKSFYYHYDENKSANKEIIKFYLHKPYLLPKIIYYKWLAAYTWCYLFIIAIGMQIVYYCTVRYNLKGRRKISILALFILLFLLIIRQLYLIPFMIPLFVIIYFKLRKDTNIQQNSFYITSCSIVLYFIFLSTILFGLNRYSNIANSIYLLTIIQFSYLLYKNQKERH